MTRHSFAQHTLQLGSHSTNQAVRDHAAIIDLSRTCAASNLALTSPSLSAWEAAVRADSITVRSTAAFLAGSPAAAWIWAMHSITDRAAAPGRPHTSEVCTNTWEGRSALCVRPNLLNLNLTRFNALSRVNTQHRVLKCPAWQREDFRCLCSDTWQTHTLQSAFVSNMQTVQRPEIQ